VDDPAALREMLDAICRLGARVPVVFPVHPRTRARIRDLGFTPGEDSRVQLLDPLGYVEMLGLVSGAKLVVTDSGGLQEETSYLGIPCLTVRQNTERPITCIRGTNRLVAPRADTVLAAAQRVLDSEPGARPVIERWDGKAASRIVAAICDGARFEVAAPTIRQRDYGVRRERRPNAAA
jgi:UDP-N-acetylglucosamine 2-epimerase (non-hydrolysing)